MKKLLAITLCAALLISALTGCVNLAVDSPSPDIQDSTAEENPPPAADDAESGENGAGSGNDDGNGFDFEAAYQSFAPDTIMLRADDFDVTWGELFFNLHSNVNFIESAFGEITDWSEILYDDITFADSALLSSVENALMYKAIEYGARLSGVFLDEEDLDIIQESFEQTIEMFGGEDELLKLLESEGLYSLDLFIYLYKTNSLADKLFSEIYGEFGLLLSDEDAAEMTDEDGYLTAKHILIQNSEEGTDDALSKADEILAQLDAYNGDDFNTFFDELMFTHSEDPGLELFQDGYLFRYGDMISSFYEATIALEPGDYSRAVEGRNGYHIVYRLPLNFDITPIALTAQNEFRTLRHLTALSLFELALLQWKEALELEHTPEFESLDFSAIFPIID